MKLQLKRSSSTTGSTGALAPVAPTEAQTLKGELCVNFNSGDPALYIEDTAGNIVRVDGNTDTYALSTTTNTSQGDIVLTHDGTGNNNATTDTVSILAGTNIAVSSNGTDITIASSVPSSGQFGYWTRSGTTLSPVNTNDSVDIGSGQFTTSVGYNGPLLTNNNSDLTVSTTGTGNNNIHLDTVGTGQVQINTDVVIENEHSLILYEASAGTNYVAHKAANSLTADATYAWPVAPGAAAYLTSDASGNLSWTTSTTILTTVVGGAGLDATATSGSSTTVSVDLKANQGLRTIDSGSLADATDDDSELGLIAGSNAQDTLLWTVTGGAAAITPAGASGQTTEPEGTYVGVTTTADSGSGCTVNFDVASNGTISNLRIANPGSGYGESQVLTIVGHQTSAPAPITFTLETDANDGRYTYTGWRTGALTADSFQGNNTLDRRYLRIEANAGAQTVASTDTTTFNGLVEAGSGVKVTGGNYDGTQTGLVGRSNSLIILEDSTAAAVFSKDRVLFHAVTGPGTTNSGLLINTQIKGGASSYGCRSQGMIQNDVTADAAAFFSRIGTVVGTNIDTVFQYRATFGDNDGTVRNSIGFSCGNGIEVGTDSNTGFDSGLNGANSFNFFSSGTAPNFFEGDTYIGGTATRSTRELWESTVTEEEKEQLAAGTLAIPANVSTPGDGSFVRQWWYDQQSAEDQALIDSGELDYPERYQAANFVDTFALGVDTNINLLSNGRGEFGGGVKVTGGSRADVDTGIRGLTDGGVCLTANANDVFKARCDGRGNQQILMGQSSGGYSDNFGTRIFSNSTADKVTFIGIQSRTQGKATNQLSGFQASLFGQDDDTPYTTANAYGFWVNQFTPGSNQTVTSFKGYSCEPSTDAFDAADTNIGFYSDIRNSGSGNDNYNFYAAGDAPNFLAGNTYIGGNTDDLGTSTNINLNSNGRIEALNLDILDAPGGTSNGSINGSGNARFARNVATGAVYADTFGASTFNSPRNASRLSFSPVNSTSCVSLVAEPTIVPDSAWAAFSVTSSQPQGTTVREGYFFLAQTSEDIAVSAGNGVALYGGAINHAISSNAYAAVFRASNISDSDGTSAAVNAGFYGALSTTNANNYNFYAVGDAPNFLRGNTYIGGTATRNTRELWESTLTEEQKEQLAAGTLAIPANVSTPGDGSFVRQWWYDQQSAEDQALLDSGELEYPTQFAAATFTDTFALGDNTNINLNSDGSAQFAGLTEHVGGVNITGGSGPQVENGFWFSKNTGLTAGSNVGGDDVSGLTVLHRGDGTDCTIASSLKIGRGSGNGSVRPDFRGIYVDDIGVSGAGDTAYGIYSDVNTTLNGINYNFYAAGNAPNYFYGTIECAPNPGTVAGALVNDNKNGLTINRGGSILQKVQNGTTGLQISKFENGQVFIINGPNSGNPSGNLVNKSVFTITNTGITATNLSATRLADARVVTLTPYSDATALVKQLNPGQEGFLAPNVALVDSSAVHGEENATEAIGTLADYDGTILETEVTEPPAEELTYTEDVTDSEGVTTQAIRTRTWTATGTRPVYQGVDQTKLIPLLTKALQEALSEIDTLKDRLDILEAN